MAGLPGYDAVVVGAGPAGVAAAAAMARRGLRVAVLEAAPRPALKPCGWGIPEAPGLPLRVPPETVLVRVRGLHLAVDGAPAVRAEGWVEGYVVDKAAFIEAVASEAGADIYYRAPYLPGRKAARIPGRGPVDLGSRVIVAGGHPFYEGETIVAVEYEARLPEGCLREDILHIDFDTGLIGYYWAFPRGGDRFQLGAGGYAGPRELLERLERWAAQRLPCRHERLTAPRGARLAVGGLRLGRLDGYPLAGEAAGFVLPLTGEGIRPSLASGYAAGEALASGRDPLKAQERLPLARAVGVQRRILERVKAMSPARRGELLKSIPARVHAEVALGTLRRSVIARELARRPGLAARLLRLVFGG